MVGSRKRTSKKVTPGPRGTSAPPAPKQSKSSASASTAKNQPPAKTTGRGGRNPRSEETQGKVATYYTYAQPRGDGVVQVQGAA